MLSCWVCKYTLSSEPDFNDDPEDEQGVDIMITCPECLTQHIYSEDSDGNLVITQAIKADGTKLTMIPA